MQIEPEQLTVNTGLLHGSHFGHVRLGKVQALTMKSLMAE